MTTTTRRAVLAAAPAAVIATAMPPAALTTDLMAPTFAEDGKIAAIGARFEHLLLQFFDATLEWAPRLAAANRESAARFGKSRHDFGIGASSDFRDAMSVEYKRNGGASASKKVYALEKRLRTLAKVIVASDETSLATLRAKALVVLWEACPICVDGLGEWNFPNDCGATRSLLAAVAQLTGLSPLLRDIEARFSATAEAIATEDAAVAL